MMDETNSRIEPVAHLMPEVEAVTGTASAAGSGVIPQEQVKRGLLAATIFDGPNAGQAVEMLVKALQRGIMPPGLTLTTPVSIPAINALAAAQSERIRLTSD